MTTPSRGRASFFVAAGILLSRLLGLVRERLFAHYFGNTDAADAFRAALRIPNLLQNLLGEGVLSASFIPVYARLSAQGKKLEAEGLARAVFGLLTLIVSLIVLAGLLAAPQLAAWLAPGFEGEKRDLTVSLLQIVFPGTGLLVFSAWCLGVLNSHHRFFLSYAAPVAWNLALIGTLLLYGEGTRLPELARLLAWGFVAGSLLQFLVQVPTTWRLIGPPYPSFAWRGEPFRRVFSGFGPTILGRGVVQISAYVDTLIASLLAPGSLSILVYTQTLASLPLSLFGMSVSAAELPLLARELATGKPGDQTKLLRTRVESARNRLYFFLVPTSLAFLVFGRELLTLLYRGGAFGPDELARSLPPLAAFALWLPSSAMGRLYASTLFATEDTRRPPLYATFRVVLGLLLSLLIVSAHRRGFDLAFEGITWIVGASAIAGFFEAFLLRRRLEALFSGRLGPPRAWFRLLAASAIAALLATGVGFVAQVYFFLDTLPDSLPGLLFRAGLTLGLFGLFYGLACWALRVPEIEPFLARFRRGRPRRR